MGACSSSASSGAAGQGGAGAGGAAGAHNEAVLKRSPSHKYRATSRAGAGHDVATSLLPYERQAVITDPSKYACLKGTHRLTDTEQYSLTPAMLEIGVNPFIVNESHFRLIKIIGKGAVAQLVLARHVPTAKLMALRVIPRKKMAKYAGLIRELKVLQSHYSPFLMSSYFSWFDNDNFVMAMPFMPGTDVWHYMWRSNEIHLDVAMSRFYMAEIICGLEALHQRNILHLDIKLENVLLGADGHVKLCDFSFVRSAGTVLTGPVGTMGFEAPEIHKKVPLVFETDVFSLGVAIYVGVTYELPFGKEVDYDHMPPFQGAISDAIYDYCGESYDTDSFVDLLRRMLEPDPFLRFSLSQVRKHAFFRGVDWNDVQKLKLEPPLMPDPEGYLKLSRYEHYPMRITQHPPLRPAFTVSESVWERMREFASDNTFLTPGGKEKFRSYCLFADSSVTKKRATSPTATIGLSTGTGIPKSPKQSAAAGPAHQSAYLARTSVDDTMSEDSRQVSAEKATPGQHTRRLMVYDRVLDGTSHGGSTGSLHNVVHNGSSQHGSNEVSSVSISQMHMREASNESARSAGTNGTNGSALYSVSSAPMSSRAMKVHSSPNLTDPKVP